MKVVRYENCIPVKGHTRSTICDIQRHEVKLIPNDLFTILTEHNGKSIKDIKAHYDETDHDVIDEYLSFLLENEYVFLTEHPEWYPQLSMEWKHPSAITNAIADINRESSYNLKKFIIELNELGCVSLELRFFDLVNLTNLEELLTFMQSHNSHINGIECYLKYSKFHESSHLMNLMNRFPRLMKLIVHNAHENRVINSKAHDQSYLAYTTQVIDSASHCGVIHKDYFTVNLSSFTESMSHNSCLNRKISVDVNGNIKNCPSMSKSYGHIDSTSLKEVIEKSSIKTYWNMSKDTISVCKDCEFRHICTDCRAYVENVNDERSKPLKCGYDPYTGTWSTWSEHPLKQDAIEYYALSKEVL